MRKIREKKKEVVAIYLTADEKKALKRMAQEEGVSLSSLVHFAISNFQEQRRMETEIQQLPQLLDKFLDLLDNMDKRLENAEKRLELLGNWVRYNAYQSTLASQLIKARLNNYLKLDKEKYEKFKKMWPELHQLVQQAIRDLTGQQVEPWDI